MTSRFGVLILAVAALAVPAMAQTSPLVLPPALEKELAARATNVTEVTLSKDMLAFAAKFMNNEKDQDETAARQLIQGLEGIYVREYEFDKDGQFSMEEIEKVRSSFETSEWQPMVRERERKTGETTDIMLKQVNGKTQGIFILTVEARELTIVLILGPIRMDDLGKLHGIAGLGGALGPVDGAEQRHHGNESQRKKDKEQEKGGKGDEQ